MGGRCRQAGSRPVKRAQWWMQLNVALCCVHGEADDPASDWNDKRSTYQHLRVPASLEPASSWWPSYEHDDDSPFAFAPALSGLRGGMDPRQADPYDLGGWGDDQQIDGDRHGNLAHHFSIFNTRPWRLFDITTRDLSRRLRPASRTKVRTGVDGPES